MILDQLIALGFALALTYALTVVCDELKGF